MELNIQQIADQKIREMHESGQVKKHLEDAVENAVLKAIDQAVNGYEIKRELENAVKKGVSSVAAEIDFTAYNGFIAEKVKQLTEGVLIADVATKLQNQFDSLFIKKTQTIALSEVLDKYRDWICESVDEAEKYDLERYYAVIEESDYGWLTFRMAKAKPERYGYKDPDECYFTFVIHRNKAETGVGRLSSVTIGNVDYSKGITFKNLSDFEVFILNLLYNDTVITVDVTDEDDIDTSFDIDR